MDTMAALDLFTQSYIECALWAEMDNSTEQGGEPLDRNYTVEDFAPEAIERIVADCQRFQVENPLPCYNSGFWSDAELAGHDFWLSRNGHGAGFFDREMLGADADRYQAIARSYGECDLYVGDDGRLYIL